MDEAIPGHGTFVSRAISQEFPNGLIYSLMVLKPGEIRYEHAALNAGLSRVLGWVRDNPKVRVVTNISSGNYMSDPRTYNLIRQLHENGVVIVASAGNDNVPTPLYPAAYEEVISVGASEKDGRKTSYSNYGSWVDVNDIDYMATILEDVKTPLGIF